MNKELGLQTFRITDTGDPTVKLIEAVYITKDTNGNLIEHHLSNIRLDLLDNPTVFTEFDRFSGEKTYSVNFGFGGLPLWPGAKVEKRIIKKKMTLSDIEKALGFEIELVDED